MPSPPHRHPASPAAHLARVLVSVWNVTSRSRSLRMAAPGRATHTRAHKGVGLVLASFYCHAAAWRAAGCAGRVAVSVECHFARALLMQPVRTCGPQAWTGGTVVRGALEVVLAVQVKVGTEHVVHHDKTDLQGGGPSRRASARPWATGASCVQRCKARRPQQSAHARREGFFLGLGLGFRA